MAIQLDPSKLPTFENLSTAHWPMDQQSQFCKAVDGILSAEWFQALTKEATTVERQRIASAFAFASFSHLRNRMRLAPDEELMQDAKGRAVPVAQSAEVAGAKAQALR